jgi:hypothetical protein
MAIKCLADETTDADRRKRPGAMVVDVITHLKDLVLLYTNDKDVPFLKQF